MTLTKIPRRALIGQVETADIADAAVTADKLSASAVADKLASVYALPASPIVDLRTFMDAEYPGGWTYRTGVGAGSDIGPAVEAACDALRTNYGRGEILFPPGGNWLWTTAVAASKQSGIKFRGIGSQASKIVWNAGSGSPINLDGAGGFTGGGAEGLTIFLEDGFAASTAVAVRLDGDSSYQPDQSIFRDLYITAIGASYWQHCLYAYGQDRTAPQGLRVPHFENMQLFRANNYTAGFFNVVQAIVANIGTYAGTGSLANNLQIGGGGTTATNTAQLSLLRMQAGGELNITNCRDVMLDGACGSLSAATTADYCWGWLHAGSTAGAFGTNSNVTVRT